MAITALPANVAPPGLRPARRGSSGTIAGVGFALVEDGSALRDVRARSPLVCLHPACIGRSWATFAAMADEHPAPTLARECHAFAHLVPQRDRTRAVLLTAEPLQ